MLNTGPIAKAKTKFMANRAGKRRATLRITKSLKFQLSAERKTKYPERAKKTETEISPNGESPIIGSEPDPESGYEWLSNTPTAANNLTKFEYPRLSWRLALK